MTELLKLTRARDPDPANFLMNYRGCGGLAGRNGSCLHALLVHRFSFVPRSLKLVRASREIAANALGGPLFIHADADIASPLSGLRALLNRVVRNAL
jgi:hypothetical protein